MNPDPGLAQFPVSFGEDAVGNLYVAYFISGTVQRIATNQLLRGDFDADGDVDNADYLKWRAGFGSANPNSASDGTGNAVFDGGDYVAWRMNLGTSVQGPPGSGVAIPEPLSGLLVVQYTAITLMLRRR
jgi:hypothetical protein